MVHVLEKPATAPEALVDQPAVPAVGGGKPSRSDLQLELKAPTVADLRLVAGKLLEGALVEGQPYSKEVMKSHTTGAIDFNPDVLKKMGVSPAEARLLIASAKYYDDSVATDVLPVGQASGNLRQQTDANVLKMVQALSRVVTPTPVPAPSVTSPQTSTPSQAPGVKVDSKPFYSVVTEKITDIDTGKITERVVEVKVPSDEFLAKFPDAAQPSVDAFKAKINALRDAREAAQKEANQAEVDAKQSSARVEAFKLLNTVVSDLEKYGYSKNANEQLPKNIARELKDNSYDHLSAEEKKAILDLAEAVKAAGADQNKAQAAYGALIEHIKTMHGAAVTDRDAKLAVYDTKVDAEAKLNSSYHDDRKNAAIELRSSLDKAAKTDAELADFLVAHDRGEPMTSFRFEVSRKDKAAAQRGENGIIDDQIKALQDQGIQLPDVIKAAYENGTIIDNKTLNRKDLRPFKGLMMALNSRNEGAMQAWAEFNDGMAAFQHAKAEKAAKDGRMTLPNKDGQVGFTWDKDGTPQRFFYGDNKAYIGGHEMQRLHAFVLNNRGVLINGQPYSDKALMEAAGVSREAVREFFASFPGTNALPNKVKAGKASMDELMLGIYSGQDNQMDVAARVTEGKRMKRDETRHILNKLVSFESVVTVAATMVTGGSLGAGLFNAGLNAVPMGDGLKLLLSLGSQQFFRRRATGSGGGKIDDGDILPGD